MGFQPHQVTKCMFRIQENQKYAILKILKKPELNRFEPWFFVFKCLRKPAFL
ncbi:hypothetical protein P872_02400 [Rhodonellum psychrophilum GCM71 = DSM 17998]|uniref:Uncharacterized protein n=1 Tax=Rhodonellum psychrophilum GCM71 = DSM 17998 TaxID=1123057 RepID=U5C0Q4_9BACT|nr:hypothetical protein P872_02400 [Rhodonellum psychrophilum GCM71 = DSM 17998]